MKGRNKGKGAKGKGTVMVVSGNQVERVLTKKSFKDGDQSVEYSESGQGDSSFVFEGS